MSPEQSKASYWASENPLPIEDIQSSSLNNPPRYNQTFDRFEGEIPASSQVEVQPIPLPPAVPSISNEEASASQAEAHATPTAASLPLQKSRESPAPAIPVIPDDKWPQNSADIDSLFVSQDMLDSQSVNNASDDGSTCDPSDSSTQSDVSDIIDNPGIISSRQDGPSAAQQENTDYEEDDWGQMIESVQPEQETYDRVMTGWDEVPPVAGQKRQHSPEPGIYRTKRGRPVKKIDYYKSHHGTVARPCGDPKTWSEAMNSNDAKHWQRAANEEYNSLRDTGTIEIIKHSQLPKGRKLMKCKWVFKKKFLSDGSINKYKARCTVKGFTQRSGIDYKETFAPTPRAETGRIMLALAHRFGWHRRQGDVPSAFLNPKLDIDLYMEMPEGFRKDGYIIRIRKGLYGLKQAAALWYDDLRGFLAKQGMFPTTTDVCLYTNKEKDLFAIIHVDDIQVMGPNIGKINRLMKSLHSQYRLKSVNTDMFLGIHISNPDKHTLKLSQGQYARKLIERHGLKDCKTVRKPLEKLLEPSGTKCSSQQSTEFNPIIGGLQYLANNTRPDIAHAVNHLARFLVSPSSDHIQAARRILRYIAKDPDQGIVFKSGADKPILEAYTDSDFAGDPSTSRSTSGLLIRLASGPICWKSRLQREVVLSSTEAEYLAATEACRELQWVKSLLEELNLCDQVEGALRTNFYVDNQSTISLIKNHDNHKRSKHVALRNSYCRQQFEKGAITVLYVPSNQQLADSFTKFNSTVAII